MIACFKTNDLYCKQIKKEFISYEPRPDDSYLFILKRYYASLKRKNSYQKNSLLEKMPGLSLETMNKAIVEYIGMYPIEIVNKHSNVYMKKSRI